MTNYANIIRAELAANSGTTEYTRDYSSYVSSSSSAWDDAPDAFFVDDEDDMDAGFFSTDEDDDMQCMFFNN